MRDPGRRWGPRLGGNYLKKVAAAHRAVAHHLALF